MDNFKSAVRIAEMKFNLSGIVSAQSVDYPKHRQNAFHYFDFETCGELNSPIGLNLIKNIPCLDFGGKSFLGKRVKITIEITE